MVKNMQPTLILLIFVCLYGSCLARRKTQKELEEEEMNKRMEYAFKNMGPTMERIQEYIPDGDGICRYNCSDGSSKRPKPGHEPSKNGCMTTKKMKVNLVYVPKMGQCCDEHDLCYDTCLNTKEDCDKKFEECLYTLCNEWKYKKSKKKKAQDTETEKDSATQKNDSKDEKTPEKSEKDKQSKPGKGTGKKNETEMSEKQKAKEKEILEKYPNMRKGCRESVDMMYQHTTVTGCKNYRDSQRKACLCGADTNMLDEKSEMDSKSQQGSNKQSQATSDTPETKSKEKKSSKKEKHKGSDKDSKKDNDMKEKKSSKSSKKDSKEEEKSKSEKKKQKEETQKSKKDVKKDEHAKTKSQKSQKKKERAKADTGTCGIDTCSAGGSQSTTTTHSSKSKEKKSKSKKKEKDEL